MDGLVHVQCKITPLSTLFRSGQCTYWCFPGFFFLPVPLTIFFPSHWLLSHITMIETFISSYRGIKSVAMIPSIYEKKLAKLRIEPVTCSQALYATNWAVRLWQVSVKYLHFVLLSSTHLGEGSGVVTFEETGVKNLVVVARHRNPSKSSIVKLLCNVSSGFRDGTMLKPSNAAKRDYLFISKT